MAGALGNGMIRLNSANGVFYPGQVISGSVTFDLHQPIQYTVLSIQFLGEADVLWTEREIENDRVRQVKYTGRDEYFNYTLTLAGIPGTGIQQGFSGLPEQANRVLQGCSKLLSGIGNDFFGEGGTFDKLFESGVPNTPVSQMPPGRQLFPFEYQIPFTAPSSFKGKKGEVSYSIIVTMGYPDRPEEKMKKTFEVVAPFDLNLGDPVVREPINLEFEEVYGCCISKPVMIRVRIPAGGYCPGQTIPIAVEVQNESNVEITKMFIQLLSKEMYRSQRPPSETVLPEKILASTKRGPFLSNCKRNFICDIVVPNILPPYLENCNIMDIGYYIRMKIKLSGCSDALEEETPICLGLIPVRETVDGEYVHPLKDRLPQGPIPDPSENPPLTVPPVNITGSNTSLHKAEYNGVQSTPYGTYPHPNQSPPNPTGSSSNVNGSNYHTSVTVKSGSGDQIEFKTVFVSSYSSTFPNPDTSNAPSAPTLD